MRTSQVKPPDPDPDRAVTALYDRYYRPLVRLAALLVPDLATAEAIVQDSFAAVHRAWPGLPDHPRDEEALCFLHRAVVHRARSAPRYAPGLPGADRAAPGRPGPRTAAATGLDRHVIVSALRALPACQREVLVLRYFAGLSEGQIAKATGVTEAVVASRTARAITALRGELPAAGPDYPS